MRKLFSNRGCPESSLQLCDTHRSKNSQMEAFNWTPEKLLASLFDVSKSRCCIAITYKGDPAGPPPRDSARWTRDRNLPKGSTQNKRVQRIYFAPLSGHNGIPEKRRHRFGREIHEGQAHHHMEPRTRRLTPPKDESSRRDFTYRETLEGKPKSKPMAQSSQPQRTMLDIARNIKTGNEEFNETDSQASMLAQPLRTERKNPQPFRRHDSLYSFWKYS